MQNPSPHYYDARELLKELDGMPALIEEKAGKRFREIAAYFMGIESTYINLKKKVEDRVAFSEKSSAAMDKKPNIIQMQEIRKKEPELPGVPAGDREEPPHEPRIVPARELLDEITDANAINLVSESMVFLDTVKTVFDKAKQDLNELYEDVKKDGERETLRLALDPLVKIQNPGEQKNPNFIADLRKGGIKRFSGSLNSFSGFLMLSQNVLDESSDKLGMQLSLLEMIKNFLDRMYESISKFYQQVLKNASKDYQNNTDENNDIYKLQMDTIGLLVEQKNLLDAMRKHLQEFASLSINLLHIKGRMLNLTTRVHTLHASLIYNIFFPGL